MARVKVWDGWVRGFHLLLATGIALAFLTAEDEDVIRWHVGIGVGLAGLFVFRVAWGLWGSRPARFAEFVRGPREVIAYARGMIAGRPRHVLGHNPVGALMVLSVLGLLAATVLSGALVYAGPEWDGALAGAMSFRAGKRLHELHETLAHAFVPLVIVHVLGVVASSFLERRNLVAGMITGYQEAAPGDLPAARGRVLGAAIAVALAGLAMFGLSRLFAVREASAGVPEARLLLAAYEAEAKAADAGFVPSAPRGKALYFAQPGARSCATCHTADVTKPGRSPAGKVIAPISPAADPDRFTTRRTADKWFDRNCEEVLGRRCTPAERADFLAYVMSP